MTTLLNPVPNRTPGLRTSLPQLREMLLEQRRFRLEQIAELAARHDPAGPSRAGHDEVAAVLEAGARHALDDVEAALARIDAGSYGVCVTCDRPIDLHQLREIPRVAVCLDCRRRAHPG